ncbi:MAG: glycoside hydrolase family 3 protein [Lachnospiraceae bacterium]|nr:glycoside hydrolase family 3 protein [Lachnospiraceae bacterium]
MILDWKEYTEAAIQAAADGAVLLKNDNRVLPIAKDVPIALFGRVQNFYFKSGTGSGGMVNVSKVWTVRDALKEEGFKLDEELEKTYLAYDEANPYKRGKGFGQEPWSQEEMPLAKEVAEAARKNTDTAVVLIGRTAGEEQDNTASEGSYYLAAEEVRMLRTVRETFPKMVLLLNVSSVIDMKEILDIAPDAVMYIWQGGMVGALGAARLVSGAISPSGRLTDTIARNLEDQPAYVNFGDMTRNFYEEDIYVGYRYFETFAKDKVLFPYGYGLSYTEFDVVKTFVNANLMGDPFAKTCTVEAVVTNVGNVSGKNSVILYVELPQGVLGQPSRRMAGYTKTRVLQPGESQKLTINFSLYDIASFDETGAVTARIGYVLEKGEYRFYLGGDVRSAQIICCASLPEDRLIQQLTAQMEPIMAFRRMKPIEKDGHYMISYENVPVTMNAHDDERVINLPAPTLPYSGDTGLKLKDVQDGKTSMDEFLAQLSDEDLCCIVRGEGMGSPKVTPGTAAAFGGVSENLKNYGIPCACCSDGPSGMRMDSGMKAFSLPNGTLLACTFDDALNEELYYHLGLEMASNQIDCLLGPGMNLHRYVLNGRNFEYFSEDPMLTGRIAAAQSRGLNRAGAACTLKHFCGNNQEKNRHFTDNVISARALRELYLKGFEIAIKEGNAKLVMTTYGPVNGVWTNTRYDLLTTILRGEWGFEGVVMTDWWANTGEVGKVVNRTNYAATVRAQNDFYAVCPDASINSSGDNLAQSLEDGTLTRGELLRSAKNICGFLLTTRAMQRMNNAAEEIEVINRKEEDEPLDLSRMVYYKVEGDVTDIPMEDVEVAIGCSYVFALDVAERAVYDFEVTASSELSPLSQTPIAFYFQGILGTVFTWNGTEGKPVTMSKPLFTSSRYCVVRMSFGGNGLKLHKIRLVKRSKNEDIRPSEDFMFG